MKNFNHSVKHEIAVIQESDCCNTALLSALIHSAGSISFSNEGVGVYFESGNPEAVALTALLIKSLYGANSSTGENELEVRGDFVPEMLFDLGILTYSGDSVGAMAGINGFVVAKECCAKSYLKGLYLGCGNVSVAKKYHLEMSFSTLDMANDVCALMCGFDITPHYLRRNDKHSVYLKSVEAISDFLALVGASKAVLELNNTAALRYVNSYTNRRINCDLANADKTVAVSMKQVEAIDRILDKLSDEKLLATARARVDNPDASYEELAEILGVSKGCIRYRLARLMDIAEENSERR